MGDLNDIFKIFFTLKQRDDETNEEIFSASKLKVRNRNNDSYRYYENDETKKILKKHMGGVFVEQNLMVEDASITAYVITDDLDMYKIVTGEEPPRDEEEEKGLEDFKDQLRKLTEQYLTDYIEKVRNTANLVTAKAKIIAEQEAKGEMPPTTSGLAQNIPEGSVVLDEVETEITSTEK